MSVDLTQMWSPKVLFNPPFNQAWPNLVTSLTHTLDAYLEADVIEIADADRDAWSSINDSTEPHVLEISTTDTELKWQTYRYVVEASVIYDSSANLPTSGAVPVSVKLEFSILFADLVPDSIPDLPWLEDALQLVP